MITAFLKKLYNAIFGGGEKPDPIPEIIAPQIPQDPGQEPPKAPEQETTEPFDISPNLPIEKQLELAKKIDYIKFAFQFEGEREIKGSKNNPKIVKFFYWAVGKEYSDETMWCMALVMGCLKQCGYQYLKSLWAADAEKLGVASKLQAGCVATKFSKAANSKRHVFFVVWVDLKRGLVGGYGGNQADSACLQIFKISDIRSTRRPVKAA